MSKLQKLFKKLEVRNRKKKSNINLSELAEELNRKEILSEIMYCSIYEDKSLFEKSNIIIGFLTSYDKISDCTEYEYFENILNKIKDIVYIKYYSPLEKLLWIGISFTPYSLFQIIKYENKQSNQFISRLIEHVKAIPLVNSYIFGDHYEFINGTLFNLIKVTNDNPIKHYDNLNEFNKNLLNSLNDSDKLPSYINNNLLYLSTVLLQDNSRKQTILFINSIMHNEYEDERFTTQCINQMTNDYSNFTVEDKHLIRDYQFLTKLVPTISEYSENENETFNDDIDEIVD